MFVLPSHQNTNWTTHTRISTEMCPFWDRIFVPSPLLHTGKGHLSLNMFPQWHSMWCLRHENVCQSNHNRRNVLRESHQLCFWPHHSTWIGCASRTCLSIMVSSFVLFEHEWMSVIWMSTLHFILVCVNWCGLWLISVWMCVVCFHALSVFCVLLMCVVWCCLMSSPHGWEWWDWDWWCVKHWTLNMVILLVHHTPHLLILLFPLIHNVLMNPHIRHPSHNSLKHMIPPWRDQILVM